MVKAIWQEGWESLHHVVSLSLQEMDLIHTLKKDGYTYEAKPIKMHVRTLQAFLMYYRMQCREAGRNLDQDDVMDFNQLHFIKYQRTELLQEHLAYGTVIPGGNVLLNNPYGSSTTGDITS